MTNHPSDDDIFLTLINEDEIDKIFTDMAIQHTGAPSGRQELTIVPPQELMIELPPIQEQAQPLLIDEDEIDEIFLREAIRHDKGKAPKRRRTSQSESGPKIRESSNRPPKRRREATQGPPPEPRRIFHHGTGNLEDFVCEFCGQNFERKNLLNRHVNLVHIVDYNREKFKSTMIECNYCKRRLKMISFLDHMRRHHQNIFDRHSKRVFRPSDYGKVIEFSTCPFCGIEIQTEYLQEHMNNICNEQLQSSIRLLPPSPANANNASSSSSSRRRRQPTFLYSCPFCDEKYEDIIMIKKHFRVHSGDLNTNIIGYQHNQIFRDSQINSFFCEKCNKFIKTDLYDQHKKFFHENYRCKKCYKQFANFQHYKYHLMLKSCRFDPDADRSYYKCTICNIEQHAKSVSTPASHSFTHLPKKCFVEGCNFVPSERNKTRSLEKHVRENHSEDEYRKLLKNIVFVNNKVIN
mgnify:CR=1 FL=1